jgi:hypothetical protein
MARDRRTQPMFEQNPTRDLAQRVIGYFQQRGWRVDRRRPHYCKTREGKSFVVGEADSLDYQATIALCQGLQLSFWFQAQIAEHENDPAKHKWMQQRRSVGVMCEWFRSEDQALDWYASTWGFLHENLDSLTLVKRAAEAMLAQPRQQYHQEPEVRTRA